MFSRVRDFSGCSETCRSLGASLSEQDGQWPAAGPLSRAQLQASSQTERKRRIPARTFKIHPHNVWLTNTEYWLNLPGHMQYMSSHHILMFLYTHTMGAGTNGNLRDHAPSFYLDNLDNNKLYTIIKMNWTELKFISSHPYHCMALKQ